MEGFKVVSAEENELELRESHEFGKGVGYEYVQPNFGFDIRFCDICLKIVNVSEVPDGTEKYYLVGWEMSGVVCMDCLKKCIEPVIREIEKSTKMKKNQRVFERTNKVNELIDKRKRKRKVDIEGSPPLKRQKIYQDRLEGVATVEEQKTESTPIMSHGFWRDGKV